MESDPEAANIIFQITILIILTLINAFFAGSEMAVVSVNKNKIRRLAEQGNKNAALIERLMEDSNIFMLWDVSHYIGGIFLQCICCNRYRTGIGGEDGGVGDALQPDTGRRGGHAYTGIF